ncbi:hypothetical protein V6N13_059586 [Hibiscus sabdariffa]|uniref:Uncharacterized protein n=1 Tax=Hibiscus sabdariffa TaxID=183260 RepID=A0ABR2GEC0_9ROSI
MENSMNSTTLAPTKSDQQSRSAQMKLDMEELSSGAALSRASSASFGLSFSFTLPPNEIAHSKPFSDDDIRQSTSIYASNYS